MSRHVAHAGGRSERWRVVFGIVRRVVTWWSRDAGDAAGCGDVQGAVGIHDEPPPAGVGLQPVVTAAQAAQVLARGATALAVRDHVVEVGPAGLVAAAGVAAVLVAGGDEAAL